MKSFLEVFRSSTDGSKGIVSRYPLCIVDYFVLAIIVGMVGLCVGVWHDEAPFLDHFLDGLTISQVEISDSDGVCCLASVLSTELAKAGASFDAGNSAGAVVYVHVKQDSEKFAGFHKVTATFILSGMTVQLTASNYDPDVKLSTKEVMHNLTRVFGWWYRKVSINQTDSTATAAKRL